MDRYRIASRHHGDQKNEYSDVDVIFPLIIINLAIEISIRIITSFTDVLS